MEELDNSNNTAGSIASADISFDASGAPVIKLSGEIDMSNVDSLRTTIEPVAAKAPDGVVFDLSALEFMDSSGIALLLQVATRTGPVQLRHPSALIRRMVEATGLADVLHLES